MARRMIETGTPRPTQRQLYLALCDAAVPIEEPMLDEVYAGIEFGVQADAQELLRALWFDAADPRGAATHGLLVALAKAGW